MPLLQWYWWLILGVLVGWLIGWLIEVFYWRRRRLTAEAPLVRAEARVKEAEASLESCQAQVAELRSEIEKRDLQIADLKRMLGARLQVPAAEAGGPEPKVTAPAVAAGLPEVEIAAPKAEAKLPEAEPTEVEVTAPEFAMALPQAEVRMDDLTRIRGIGPKLAQTLQAAGIASFAQLAEADEERLAAIIQAPAWRRLDYGDWILQARALRDLPPAPAMPGDDLERIEGIGPKYASLLREAGITTFAELAASDEATLTAIIGAPAWRRVDYAMWIEQARLAAAGEEAALAELQARLHRREGDNLTLIQGIGARTAAALRYAGIASFADLAAANEAQLAGIIEAAGVRGGDYTAWIEEAKLRAAGRRVVRQRAVTAERVGIPNDLSQIKDIGEVFEQKLYQAGIMTFADLAARTPEELKAIIQPEEWQALDFADWIAQARARA